MESSTNAGLKRKPSLALNVRHGSERRTMDIPILQSDLRCFSQKGGIVLKQKKKRKTCRIRILFASCITGFAMNYFLPMLESQLSELLYEPYYSVWTRLLLCFLLFLIVVLSLFLFLILGVCLFTSPGLTKREIRYSARSVIVLYLLVFAVMDLYANYWQFRDNAFYGRLVDLLDPLYSDLMAFFPLYRIGYEAMVFLEYRLHIPFVGCLIQALFPLVFVKCGVSEPPDEPTDSSTLGENTAVGI